MMSSGLAAGMQDTRDLLSAAAHDAVIEIGTAGPDPLIRAKKDEIRFLHGGLQIETPKGRTLVPFNAISHLRIAKPSQYGMQNVVE